MLGHAYPVFIGGKIYGVDGTSASTPVFAAVVSLVNAQRLAAGKSTLGWLYSALYSIAKTDPAGVFNDVTDGSNKTLRMS